MNNLKYHYKELLKLLVVMSSESEVQLKAHGMGNAEEEMSIDLEYHFLEYKDQLVKKGLLSKEEEAGISKLEAFFDARRNDDNEDFWFELETHADWIEVRALAKDVLILMKKDHVTLDINVKTETSWFSQNVSTQEITIELVDNA